MIKNCNLGQDHHHWTYWWSGSWSDHDPLKANSFECIEIRVNVLNTAGY